MALAFLLDENISDVVARQLQLKRAEIEIHSVYFWRDGAFRGKSDARLLRAAVQDGLTLITYDQKTIPPLLSEWGVTGENHAGVLFVDNRTIRQGDIGEIVRALIDIWDRTHSWDWANAVDFLRRS